MGLTPGPVVLAAGDIADDEERALETAALLKRFPDATILALGDNAYRCGSSNNYKKHYSPSWGDPSLLSRTRACPGNHEYGAFGCIPSQKGKGYFKYFEASHADVWAHGKEFYSFSIANCRWLLVSLNSEISTEKDSRQLQWLRATLGAHKDRPILAFFHRPCFSSGSHGSQSDLQELWNVLAQFKTEIVLNGHDHSYERFHKQNAAQQRDDSGIAAFVVGTGGREHEEPQSQQETNSAFVPMDALGVLRLTLRDRNYDWEFLSTTNQVLDAGHGVQVNEGHV